MIDFDWDWKQWMIGFGFNEYFAVCLGPLTIWWISKKDLM